MDEFCTPTAKTSMNEMLTPGQLKLWEDAEVLAAAKGVRSRQQELQAELKRRGYSFLW